MPFQRGGGVTAAGCQGRGIRLWPDDPGRDQEKGQHQGQPQLQRQDGVLCNCGRLGLGRHPRLGGCNLRFPSDRRHLFVELLVGQVQVFTGSLVVWVDLQRLFEVGYPGPGLGNRGEDQPGVLHLRQHPCGNLGPVAGFVFIAALQCFVGQVQDLAGWSEFSVHGRTAYRIILLVFYIK